MPTGTSPGPVIHRQSGTRQPQVAPKVTRQVAAQFQCQSVENVVLSEGPWQEGRHPASRNSVTFSQSPDRAGLLHTLAQFLQ